MNCTTCRGQGKLLNMQGSAVKTCHHCDGTGKECFPPNMLPGFDELYWCRRSLFVPLLCRKWNNPSRTYWADPEKETAGLWRIGIARGTVTFQPKQPAEFIVLQFSRGDKIAEIPSYRGHVKDCFSDTEHNPELETPPWEK